MLYFIISLLTYFTYLIFKGRKYLSYFVEKKYNFKKIKLFSLDKYFTLELIGLLLIISVFFLNSKTIGIIFLVFYTIMSLIEIKNSKKIKLNNSSKLPILITTIIYIAVFAIIIIDHLNYQKGFIFYDRINYYYIIVYILGYLEYLILYLSYKLCKKSKAK